MSKQNGNKGRRFDRAFKEEAVRLLQTSGRRQRQIAGDLGISVSALGRWVAELREEDLLSGPHEDAAKEITRLRRERDLARQERDLLKKSAGLLRQGKSMRFRFIDAERAGLAMPIFRLCRLLQVSVSGFYAWRNRGPSQRQLDDMVLLAHVRAAFRRSRESYGAERVHHELAENGIEVGRHRVARLMRGNGLSPKRKQKFKKTTDSQHNKAVASNLLDQNFSAEAPNEKWAADISYIWTAQGWLYLAVMLDLYSRRVIGWAVGARMTSDLPLRALNRAIGLRQPGAGVIHHSDRGSQYCSDAYQARLGELGFLASMSGKGNCYDNAVVETFFKTIKSELIWRTVFMSRSQAETAIAGYIDGFYNPVRRHSTLDSTSPVKFEAEAMQTV